jgi:hypothetical protein
MHGGMDRALHKRYLDYRDTFEYFGRKMVRLTAEEFAKAEVELRELDAKGNRRDADDETRKTELERILFRS